LTVSAEKLKLKEGDCTDITVEGGWGAYSISLAPTNSFVQSLKK